MSNLAESIKSLIVSPGQRSADMALLRWDVWASQAHACMLFKTGILTKNNAAKLLKALTEIAKQIENGNFEIDPERGAQLSLEAEVIKLAGAEAGLSLHTARSRNDQIMVAESLYSREQALQISAVLSTVQEKLLQQASKHIHTVMPGYTHMQPAKPSTFAQWCLAYFDSFERVQIALQQVLDLYDACPLGAVESFGSSWPIDRAYTASLLGFSRIWEVPQDAISNRGSFQLGLIGVLNQMGISISKLAQDLMLYSTFEYRLVDFGEQVAQRLHPITGSSVMAQKRNPDALELLRSLAPQISGMHQILSSLFAGLPSGYNRDPREAKEYVELAFAKSLAALEALGSVLEALQPDTERMRKAVLDNYSLTTDLADYLAQQNKLPYRLVYKLVGKVVDRLIEQGRALSSLRAEELSKEALASQISLEVIESDLSMLKDPELALQRRQQQGLSLWEATEKMLEARRQKLNNFKQSLEAKKQQIRDARLQTSVRITSIIE